MPLGEAHRRTLAENLVASRTAAVFGVRHGWVCGRAADVASTPATLSLIGISGGGPTLLKAAGPGRSGAHLHRRSHPQVEPMRNPAIQRMRFGVMEVTDENRPLGRWGSYVRPAGLNSRPAKCS